MAKKYIDNPPMPYYIPAVNNATSNSRKTFEFTKTFFPPPPPATLDDINNTIYPQPVPCQQAVTPHQTHHAVSKASPKKAPGPDKITNQVLKKSYDVIQHHLHALVQASINTAHFPAIFKTTTIIVLRKPAKPDYTKPNAYRPIALENTMGKIIESTVTEILSYISEENNLLPPQHYGGRPGRTGEDAMMILAEKIYNTWKEQEVYSVVFMDVAGAFNNVHHERLYHNMWKRRVPSFIVRWVESFLTGRSTILRFHGIDSERIAVNAGVPQGSPISPILYLYYNSDLLEIPGSRGMSLGFIDDIAYGVQGESDKENAKELERMLIKADRWRERHGARFETSKYVLIHFTRNGKKETNAHITISDTTIEPSEEARYLGVILDKGLRFRQHIQYATNKGTKFALAISRIAKSTWGATYVPTRTLFNAVVAARMDYAAIVWHRPTKHGRPPASLSKLETAQRTAMKAILGAFCTTTTSAMEIDTSLLPAHLRLRRKILQSMARMQTTQENHPIHQTIKRAMSSTSGRHISTLEYLTRSFPELVKPLETIKPYAHCGSVIRHATDFHYK